MATTVTRLPTAAPRKVNNSRFAEQRRAARQMRIDSRWDERFMPDANPEPELIRTPELFILMMMMKAMPTDAFARLLSFAHSTPEYDHAAKAGAHAITLMAYYREACQRLVEVSEREGC